MATRSCSVRGVVCIARRGLITVTPARSSPRQLTFSPARQTLASKTKPPKNYFSSNRVIRKQQQADWQHDEATKSAQKAPKRKAARSQAAGTSLRRVAVEAQRSRDGIIRGSGGRRHVNPDAETKVVSAFCAAEQYNISIARHHLKQEGYEADPFRTDLYPQVLHVQTPNYVRPEDGVEQGVGDLFVFPSGSVVTWNVPDRLAQSIVRRVLLPAAENSHLDSIEAENLDYVEDPTKENSKIIGDTIVLGTKISADLSPESNAYPKSDSIQRPDADTVLAKVAFSSGIARSTKLAVLENTLDCYFTSTRSIPRTLSKGFKLRMTRKFILRKTGELLSIRAQLNLYSELTDSLPDLFWDSPHELGLEGYYEQVGRALDVAVRIKVLNEKMDYAYEIAAVLRERLSEKHSTDLEWLIIFLISVEVGFEIRRIWLEKKADSTDELLKRLEKEGCLSGP